jgi:hypothetical protein
MKPYIHAQSSVKKWGGKVEDYLKIHDWFDETKAHFGDNRHRALRHHSQGIFEAERLFGHIIVNSDKKEVSVRDVGEQHVYEDLGFIPSVADYLNEMVCSGWMCGSRKEKEKEKNVATPLPITVLLDTPFHINPKHYDGNPAPVKIPLLKESQRID